MTTFAPETTCEELTARAFGALGRAYPEDEAEFDHASLNFMTVVAGIIELSGEVVVFDSEEACAIEGDKR
jgi:hypothetical protein